MINDLSQTIDLYEYNEEFNLFEEDSSSGMRESISQDLEIFYSIDSSSVNPVFKLKNDFSTLISDFEIGEEIKFNVIPFDVDFFSEIYDSKRFINLKDNWDGLGSIGYKLETWIKMKEFLIRMAQEFYYISSLTLPTPYINLGKSGAFDLHWKTKKFELLVRIPEENEVPISFYGDNYKEIKIRGTLEITKLDALIEWIKLYI